MKNSVFWPKSVPWHAILTYVSIALDNGKEEQRPHAITGTNKGLVYWRP